MGQVEWLMPTISRNSGGGGRKIMVYAQPGKKSETLSEKQT
jgi:hypothetical protein